MAPLHPWSHEIDNDDEQDITLQYPAIRNLSRAGTLEQNFIALEQPGTMRSETDSMKTPQDPNIYEDNSADAGPHRAHQVELPVIQDAQGATKPLPVVRDTQEVTKPLPLVQDAQEITRPLALVQDLQGATKPLPVVQDAQEVTKPLVSLTGKVPETPRPGQELVPVQAPSRPKPLKRGTALLLIAFLGVIVLHTLMQGPASFLGSQGWASVINGPAMTGNTNLLKNIDTRLKQNTRPGTKTSTKAQLTPQQYIDLIVNKMSLSQKLGQMMIVQFTGSTYALPISTMISQYNVGAVLVFSANGNIVSKNQLSSLIKQMKGDSTTIPLAVAIDQEGGTVDRLVNLDGPRPAEATLGASNDPAKAKQAGMQDAKDLTSYGFNLNLAPVVDVSNVYNSQLYGRTYGNTPGLVTKMAAAYLQGLQKSGKVVGTLKHFPGLGNVATDPHLGIPYLNRSKDDLERIDWAPYRALIRQGNVHAIMVTHEIVAALDKTEPSSLSPKIIQGILRNDLGFQGVIMTDSLTMDALTAYASESQAAVLSVEAGADLLMGAASPQDVAAMIQALKQAINTGTLTEQRIDESVRRLLMMKYAMGLLPIPQNRGSIVSMVASSTPETESKRIWPMAQIVIIILVILETVLVLMALVPAQLWTRLLPQSPDAALNGPFPPLIAPVITALIYLIPTFIGLLNRSWQRALLYATLPAWIGLGAFVIAATFKVGAFYLVSADHVTANISVLELFAALGGIGWLARHLLKMR